MTQKVRKTDEQWRRELQPERYEVLRCGATEPPWSGELLVDHGDGVYRCGACGAELFRSDTKFE
jgi:peptide-methionine (R)-S-oxide reductase